MSRAILVATCLAGLLSGCGSSLKFTVQRYDIDGHRWNRDCSTRVCRDIAKVDPQVRAAYEKAHPPAVSGDRSALEALLEVVQQMKGESAYVAWLGAKLFETNEKKADALAAFEKRASEAYADLDKALGIRASYLGSKDRVGTAAADSYVAYQIARLPEVLEAKNIGDPRSRLQTLLEQMAEVPALKALAETNAQPIADALKAMPAPPPSAQEALARLSSGRDLTSVIQASVAKVEKASTQRDAAFNALIGGDGVERKHEVFQDMSDPFLTFIAAHPDYWHKLDNEAFVSGDGDTEYVMILENAVDARWSSVSVDPEKVIRARMQMARGATRVLAAAFGTVSGLGAVTIPTAASGEESQAPTKDYAQMVAETKQLELSIDSRKRAINRVKQAAADAGAINATTANTVRQRLLLELDAIAER